MLETRVGDFIQPLQPEETLSVSDVTSSFAAIHHHDMDPSIIEPNDYP